MCLFDYFIGHAGHETVDLAYSVLPDMIEQKLRGLLLKGESKSQAGVVSGGLSSDDISTMLRDTIKSLDDRITREILELFVASGARSTLDLVTLQEEAMKAIEGMRDEDIIRIIDDGGDNQMKLLRGMRGTTALVALIAPPGMSCDGNGKGRGIWVASLGDCVAGE